MTSGSPRSRRGKRRGRDESSEEKGRGKKRGRGGRVDYVEESSSEESEESEEEEYDEDDLFATAQVQPHCFRTHLFEPAARGHCGTTERAMRGHRYAQTGDRKLLRKVLDAEVEINTLNQVDENAHARSRPFCRQV